MFVSVTIIFLSCSSTWTIPGRLQNLVNECAYALTLGSNHPQPQNIPDLPQLYIMVSLLKFPCGSFSGTPLQEKEGNAVSWALLCAGHRAGHIQGESPCPQRVAPQPRGHAEKPTTRGFPGGAVVKNPPANAGDMGLSPGPGRSHMLRSN